MAEDPATHTSKSRIAEDSRLHEAAGGVGSDKSGRTTAGKDLTSTSSIRSDVRGPVTLSARINFWSTLLTALTAIIALVLSIITYLQVNSRATISMTMPNAIAFWSQQHTLRVVLKPTFTVDKKTDIAAAVMDTTLRLEATVANQQPMTLPWFNVVDLKDTGKVSIQRVWRGLAEPFLVTPDATHEGAMEFAIFAPSDRLHVVAGRWNATLTVQRLGESPIIRNFCVDMPDDFARALNESIKKDKNEFSGLYWLNDFTPNPPQSDDVERSEECYHVVR
jgi:hypothetical protein